MNAAETVRKINRELTKVDARFLAWAGAIDNAHDSVRGRVDIVMDGIAVPEFENREEYAVAIYTIQSMRGILCSADEYGLTQSDVVWFATHGIEA